MQQRVTAAVFIHLEHRPHIVAPAFQRRAIPHGTVAALNHSAVRHRAIHAIRNEIMRDCITAAIGIDREHSSKTAAAAGISYPNQSSIRIAGQQSVWPLAIAKEILLKFHSTA